MLQKNRITKKYTIKVSYLGVEDFLHNSSTEAEYVVYHSCSLIGELLNSYVDSSLETTKFQFVKVERIPSRALDGKELVAYLGIALWSFLPYSCTTFSSLRLYSYAWKVAVWQHTSCVRLLFSRRGFLRTLVMNWPFDYLLSTSINVRLPCDDSNGMDAPRLYSDINWKNRYFLYFWRYKVRILCTIFFNIGLAGQW